MEAAGSVVWLIGGESPDQKFIKNYLERNGYVNRIFFTGEECLEYLAWSRRCPDVVMILDAPEGTMSAEETERQIAGMEPGLAVFHLCTMQVFAIRQRAYSLDTDIAEDKWTVPMVNSALSRLTNELIKLSARE